MVQEMSKKQQKLPARPKPPSGKEIVHDITNARPGDIAFTLFRNVKSDLTPSSETANLMMESFISQDDMLGSPLPPADSVTADDAENKTSPNIETLYKQAVQFLEVSEKLKEAPDCLKTKCEELQKLDQELKESINSLKKQSHSLLNSSSNKLKKGT